jgi:hypothetical protein
MTAVALAPAPTLRPVPWSRLAWVAWRRYRVTLIATAAVLAVLAVSLVVTGEHMRSAYDAVKACHPASAANCRFLDEQFHAKYGGSGFLAPVLLFLPGILGAFAGAPLLARELETGTFRYAWTQGVGRMRWAVSLLVPGAVGVAVVMAAFGALVSWHQQPLIDYGVRSRLEPSTFPTTGVAVAGWALAGFALAVLAGLLWRRVLPGVATAFALWFGLALLAAKVRGLGYLAPLKTTSLQLSSRNLFVSQWWTKGGVRVSEADMNKRLESLGANVSGGSVSVHVGPGGVDPFQYLQQHGYQQITSYQPASRYWPFQWIELGWLTALSLVLLGTTFWLLRRRAA